ncbi:hypothetical protein [Paenibacillus glycanilyticus]|uniref:Uncharacterized protein n=1 Tax=Paenibacillus glycanilyticus TaxID=126569 RepID=A0ABQ6GBN5_9BACL|nr:hypothetical protein [Paenibacillus glycanilyticus]GLX66487.1 hypothetical protein MU1_08310 [Paenibacillus glycanilyticus]
MKNTLIACYLAGGIISIASLSFMSVPQPVHKLQTTSAFTESATAEHADYNYTVPDFKLQSVNGLSLYDDKVTVQRMLGKPAHVSRDDYFTEFETYEYPNLNIVFREGVMEEIKVSGSADTIRIDDQEIPVSIEALIKALGEPDYKADDGIVYQRQENVLKLFINYDKGTLDSIAYYHISSV